MYLVAFLSDHRYICFDINKDVSSILIYRDPKNRLGILRINLEETYGTCNKKLLSKLDVDLAVDYMQEVVLPSYCNSC
jgi:hypothetical protein